jgi:predicted nucleic acid-binding protein
VIAYFDTSAVVPLVIEEASTVMCARLWNGATRVVSARLLYPEARAALARAHRLGRVDASQVEAAVADLDALFDEFDVVELTPELARSAGELAQRHALRGYDAVHLAAAVAVHDDDVVVVTGDVDLAAAVRAAGMAAALTTS